MKTIIAIFLIFTSLSAAAQLRFNDTEYFQAAVVIDPVASIKEKGLNIGAEIELISYWGYVRASSQSFFALEGGYVDLMGALGVNFKYGHFSPFRFYTGVRLGAIYRDLYPYPTVGAEAGIDLYTRGNFVLGVRTTYDLRTDFEYWGGEEEMRLSSFIKLGFTF